MNQTERNKRIKLSVIAILALIIICELGYIIGTYKLSGGRETADWKKSEGVLAVSPKNVKINDELVNSYIISGKDGIYIIDYDLEQMGFECRLADQKYVLTYAGILESKTIKFIDGAADTQVYASDKKLIVGNGEYECYDNEKGLLIPVEALGEIGNVTDSEASDTIYLAFGNKDEIIMFTQKAENEIAAAEGREPETITPENTKIKEAVGSGDAAVPNASDIPASEGDAPAQGKKVIVLDPGHGLSSSLMTDEMKTASGWVKNSRGQWGEWRHYKKGSSTEDCQGSGCNGRVTPNGACWYPIGNGDRNTEPDINLKNALAAEKYLKQMNYEVRLTRRTNDENPSITKRISYCYPNNDSSQTADAELFLCIHSNAGGGSGSAYISLEGPYDQRGIGSDYAESGNTLGKLCNDSIVNNTSLKMSGNGVISFEPELIAFCKSPVTCGYLEIGFFDNAADKAILDAEYDSIGKAIAEGIDSYFGGNR